MLIFLKNLSFDLGFDLDIALNIKNSAISLYFAFQLIYQYSSYITKVDIFCDKLLFLYSYDLAETVAILENGGHFEGEGGSLLGVSSTKYFCFTLVYNNIIVFL